MSNSTVLRAPVTSLLILGAVASATSVLADGNHRVVTVDGETLTVLADSYQGNRHNCPDDLVYRSDGSVYFTDPRVGLPKFYDDPRKELDRLYRIALQVEGVRP